MARWASQVPEDFRFAVKASRRITHIKRLKEVAETTWLSLHGRSRTLGPKLRPPCVQLPPNLKRDDRTRLSAFLAALPAGAAGPQ